MTETLIRFYRLIEQARPPQRADRAAIGTLPTRAARYCDAVTAASAFGWYVFPPMGFSLLWEGGDIFWTYDDAEDWLPLEAAQYPGFVERFDAAAPPAARGFSPPFLTALPEPGAVQVWTGLIARTAPDWSLLVRAPANIPLPGGFTQYEGIIESDRWFGPLFTNLRLTRTGTPIRIKPDFPLLQIQPLPRQVYAESSLAAGELVASPDPLAAADWDDYVRTVVLPNHDHDRPLGNYAVASRRRRQGACPVALAD